MSSLPNISINSRNFGSPYPSLTYPSLTYPSQSYPSPSYPSFPTSQIISATALTPSSLIPPTFPSVPTVSSLINLSSYAPLRPIYPSVISYPDVNSNRELRRQVTEYFFDKVIKNWLKYHYLSLYDLVVVSGGVASLIKDVKHIETSSKSVPSENAIKYEFIIDNFLTKNDVYTLLDKFRKINQLNWWDLKHHTDKVRKYIEHKVKKYMLSQIVSKK